MDYSNKEQPPQPPPAYSQVNAPAGQPYPYGQAQAPYQPGQQQPGVYPAGPGAAYAPGPGKAYAPGPGQAYAPGPGQAYAPGPGQAYAPAPGQVVVTQPMVITGPIGAPPPPDYMIPSILVCLFCFCPTGIFAIYYANRRTQLVAEGDMVEAQRSADCARNLMIASVVCGILWIILVIVLRVVLYTSYYHY